MFLDKTVYLNVLFICTHMCILISGELEYSPAVDRLVRRIYNYSDDLADCHYPKPILLPTGEVQFYDIIIMFKSIYQIV